MANNVSPNNTTKVAIIELIITYMFCGKHEGFEHVTFLVIQMWNSEPTDISTLINSVLLPTITPWTHDWQQLESAEI